jgi:hypothetical protein
MMMTKPYFSSVKIGGQDPGNPGHPAGERISSPKIVSHFEWFWAIPTSLELVLEEWWSHVKPKKSPPSNTV